MLLADDDAAASPAAPPPMVEPFEANVAFCRLLLSLLILLAETLDLLLARGARLLIFRPARKSNLVVE